MREGAAAIVSGKHSTQVQAGDRVLIETPGGGGWGKVEPPPQTPPPK